MTLWQALLLIGFSLLTAALMMRLQFRLGRKWERQIWVAAAIVGHDVRYGGASYMISYVLDDELDDAEASVDLFLGEWNESQHGAPTLPDLDRTP